MTMEQVMIDRFGVLLDIDQLSRILHKSPRGLRMSLRSSTEWAMRINATKVRMGKRIYFRTADIATILSEKEAA